MSTLSPSLHDKRRITVIYRGRAETVSWYPDATPSEIERLIRQLYDLPSYVTLLLRDLDGDAIVISPNLPHNRTFTLYTEDKTLSSSAAVSSPSAAYSSRLGASYTSPLRSSSPLRAPGSASAVSSSPLRSSAYRPLSPSRLTYTSPSRSRLSTSALDESLRLSTAASTSAAPADMSPSRAASSQLAKEALDRVDKLRTFEKRVRDLRDDKFREFFELSPITGDWAWKKDVTSGEFMSAISTDLYWNAGSCGLLSTRRREEVDRILNGALSAYMDAVRELGRRGNFEPVVTMEASFAREALRAAYDEVVNVVQQIVHEKIKEAEIYTRDSF